MALSTLSNVLDIHVSGRISVGSTKERTDPRGYLSRASGISSVAAIVLDGGQFPRISWLHHTIRLPATLPKDLCLVTFAICAYIRFPEPFTHRPWVGTHLDAIVCKKGKVGAGA